MTELIDQIPGLREAIERENSAWDAAWLGLNESICGIEVLPYTPRHDLILGSNGMQSPFLGGEFPSVGIEVARAASAFMWVVSPKFGKCGEFQKIKYLRAIAKLPARDLISGIFSYVDAAFSDAPSSSGAERQDFYSWFAGYCDLFASEYGWKPEDLIDRPMKQIFQLAKSMKERKKPDCHLFKPSDRIAGQWLAAKNQKARTN